MNNLNVAVIGATNNIGQEILKTLEERDFPLGSIAALTHGHGVGSEISFGDKKTLVIKSIEGFDFSPYDLCFFVGSQTLAQKTIPTITKSNCIVIDNSGAFAMDPDVPLIVSEANATAIANYEIKKIIAAPSSISTHLAPVLKPLHDLATLKRVVVSTYQAVSDLGREAMDELFAQTRAVYVNNALKKENFTKQIAFNVIPHIGDFKEDGSTNEEFKIAIETKKIIHPSIKVSVTCVRVPIFIGHGQAVNLEFENEISAEDARKSLEKAQGITVIDHQHADGFSTPAETAGEDPVFVSRIREDISLENGLNLWVTGDNLRKGSALNMIQIAELLNRDYF